MTKEEKSIKAKHAMLARAEKAEERGSYNTEEGMISYKLKRGHKVYKYTEDYILVKEYLCIADALRDLGMNRKNTSCIGNYLNTGKLYKGFI